MIYHVDFVLKLLQGIWTHWRMYLLNFRCFPLKQWNDVESSRELLTESVLQRCF